MKYNDKRTVFKTLLFSNVLCFICQEREREREREREGGGGGGRRGGLRKISFEIICSKSNSITF